MADNIKGSPERAPGEITTEERAQLRAYAQVWIDNAVRTDRASAAEVERSVQDLYEAAGLKKPAVALVPSPLAACVTYGFAAAILELQSKGEQVGINLQAVTSDLGDTAQAVLKATLQILRFKGEISPANTTNTLTSAPSGDYSWIKLLALRMVGDKAVAKAMVNGIASWYFNFQGGNAWGAWTCYLSGAKEILGLQLPKYEKYEKYVRCAQTGGFRVLHDDFCVVSDFPEILARDERMLPHSTSGPSHKWRDGWSLYHVHGIRVKKQIIEAPETMTIEQITGETNAEIRRIMIERFGQVRFIQESGAVKVHEDDYGVLYKKELQDDEPVVMVKVVNSTPESDGTYKDYYIRVAPNVKTAREAVAWTFGKTADEYALVAES